MGISRGLISTFFFLFVICYFLQFEFIIDLVFQLLIEESVEVNFALFVLLKLLLLVDVHSQNHLTTLFQIEQEYPHQQGQILAAVVKFLML